MCTAASRKRPDEPLPVLAELRDVGPHAGGDVVDRHEERHLPFAERVDDLAVAAADLEDALPVGDELHVGQMPVEAAPSC